MTEALILTQLKRMSKQLAAIENRFTAIDNHFTIIEERLEEIELEIYPKKPKKRVP